MTSPQRQRVAAADLIARHLVAYHSACAFLLQADRAATLANALICTDLQADGYRAAAASLRVISQETPLDGGVTSPAGIRAEAAATLAQLVRHEADPMQRLRLRGVVGGLLVIWRLGTVHHGIACDVYRLLATNDLIASELSYELVTSSTPGSDGAAALIRDILADTVEADQ